MPWTSSASRKPGLRRMSHHIVVVLIVFVVITQVYVPGPRSRIRQRRASDRLDPAVKENTWNGLLALASCCDSGERLRGTCGWNGANLSVFFVPGSFSARVGPCLIDLCPAVCGSQGSNHTLDGDDTANGFKLQLSYTCIYLNVLAGSVLSCARLFFNCGADHPPRTWSSVQDFVDVFLGVPPTTR